MKILIDMNLSPSWVRVLEDAGMEAAHSGSQARLICWLFGATA